MKKTSFKEIEISLPVGYSEEELKTKIGRSVRSAEFAFEIRKKSLDARKKSNIHWVMKIIVYDKNISRNLIQSTPGLEIPIAGKKKKAIVVGSGPAGFFAADILLRSGLEVVILERGYDVSKRTEDIENFESSGKPVENSNYAYGEGGAGTFSDGKLTSRTKDISLERQYVFDAFVKAGGPEEIKFLAMPHLGSDNLINIAAALRRDYISRGGRILFSHQVTDIMLDDSRVKSVVVDGREFEADHFVFAIGHSAYDTYSLLNSKGVQMESKPFAIGVRVEHPQEMINVNQWGVKDLPGLKAAEYRLTFPGRYCLPVYSFCMCPGGRVIPATPRAGLNIVNGVSDYRRSSRYANSAIVAAVDLEKISGKAMKFEDIAAFMEDLESRAYKINNDYSAPANRIRDFIQGNVADNLPESSYPFGLIPCDFAELLPKEVVEALRFGLSDFSNKIRGFENGIMLGIEATTSSPIRLIRDEQRRLVGFSNLYAAGEGSGYSGGIVSSAADGILTALAIINSL
ncbi:MAG: FAD-dependent monooxygenase [bacterium]